ncbi:PEP-CTERM sorting domain-containing protein [Luteolibacter pohnpeiensis]|uniref:PEP-CTERM sorting domain-containing protein n=1 Tax=Luteolibacter pohnpeiensis TaxID=454153 RepID=A0A934VXC3_9BACT|nr:PEP-CTERM sorting domain-containing protein [Luteolibacter pohnpeiensis]MBK1883384.1 PEP-CTERM sorting domain-containing protein [Luteolibacter pohnpeiensis]
MKFAILPSVIAFCSFVQPAAADIAVYFSPNDIESAEASGIVGAKTETFSNASIGTLTTYRSNALGGTYTSVQGTSYFQVNNRYGASNGGTQFAVKGGAITSLTLDEEVSYFGFYFTAGDIYNSIDLYSGDTLLMAFSTETLIDYIPRTAGTTVTAIDGNTYNTIDYYGQPVTNLNGNEPYAYIHFFATDGTTIDRIDFHQEVNTNTSVFENDNHSTLVVAPTVPGSFVYLIPEPSSLILSSLGLLFGVRRRR